MINQIIVLSFSRDRSVFRAMVRLQLFECMFMVTVIALLPSLIKTIIPLNRYALILLVSKLLWLFDYPLMEKERRGRVEVTESCLCLEDFLLVCKLFLL